MSEPRRVYLCRHGDALGPDDDEDQLFSVANNRLSPRGVAQAEALRDALRHVPLDAVVASPLQRTHHTAEVIAGPHGLPVQVDPRLVELGFTHKDGPRTYEAILGAIRDFAIALHQGDDPMLPNGEAYSEVRERILDAVTDLTDAHERVLVAAHGAVNRVLLAEVLAMDPAHMFTLEQHPGCLNVLERRRDQWRVLLVNHTPGRSLG